MSTLGCALRCPHTLPASVLTVTVTKRLTAEITVTTLHRNWGSTLSLFLFFYFLVCSDKNDPLFPMNTLLHTVALPLFLPPLPSASQSITILQQEGLSLCFTPGVSRPSPSPVGMGCFFFSPSSASLTHPLPTNHWSSACAALPAFNACCIVCAEHELEVAGERLVSAFWARLQEQDASVNCFFPEHTACAMSPAPSGNTDEKQLACIFHCVRLAWVLKQVLLNWNTVVSTFASYTSRA